MTPTNHDRLSISPFRVDSLAAASPEAPDWLWRGCLAPSQLTLLTSLWKSGKTTLLLVLLARMKAGGDLLGMPVRPACGIFPISMVGWHVTAARRVTFRATYFLEQETYPAKSFRRDSRRLRDRCPGMHGPYRCEHAHPGSARG